MTLETGSAGSEHEKAELIARRKKQVWKVAGVMILAFVLGTALLFIILWLVLVKLLPPG